jgi:hypothetical protein
VGLDLETGDMVCDGCGQSFPFLNADSSPDQPADFIHPGCPSPNGEDGESHSPIDPIAVGQFFGVPAMTTAARMSAPTPDPDAPAGDGQGSADSDPGQGGQS